MSDLVAELSRLLGSDLVSDDRADRAAHAHDWSAGAFLDLRTGRDGGQVACVVRPETTQQVAAVLEWAQTSGTPVVPYGGGSSVCRGISGVGGIALDTGGMWQLLDIDEKSRLVDVQAGISGPQLEEALTTQGWFLGHHPQSIDISSVGGWVATRACGQLSARYGGIESLVAGLEAVLPGGRVVTSKPAPRRSVGPDLMSLLLGSEGTLGVITRVVLRVVPRPGERVDRCVRFDHMNEGVAACRKLAQSDLVPTVVRLYDAVDSTLFLRNHPDEPQGPLLILSFDGHGAAERADRAVELAGGTPGNDALAAHWWAHRNDAVDQFRNIMSGEGLLGPHGLVDTMEVSGTWTVLRDLYHRTRATLEPLTDLVGCHISHIYPDGACLYFTMAAACSDDDEATARLARWWEAGMATCLEAGGSISHHHGIGRLKAPWLEAELGGWWQVLKAVKGAIDPKGIMNPGVLGL